MEDVGYSGGGEKALRDKGKENTISPEICWERCWFPNRTVLRDLIWKTPFSPSAGEGEGKAGEEVIPLPPGLTQLLLPLCYCRQPHSPSLLLVANPAASSLSLLSLVWDTDHNPSYLWCLTLDHLKTCFFLTWLQILNKGGQFGRQMLQYSLLTEGIPEKRWQKLHLLCFLQLVTPKTWKRLCLKVCCGGGCRHSDPRASFHLPLQWIGTCPFLWTHLQMLRVLA